MARAPHPGKTPAQRRVLDQIGCGNYSPAMSSGTRAALLMTGLIQPCGVKVVGHDRLGMVTIDEYQMPTAVHIRWCEAMASEEDAG